MKWSRSALAVALLTVAAGIAEAQIPTVAAPCSVSTVAPSPDSPNARRVGALRGGDLLKINVFRTKELSGDYLIDSQGRLVIPGLGVLQASGLEPRQVEQGLRELLACRGIQPEVSVQAQIRVSVLGEVRNPGIFPVDPGITLLQLLTVAGGETPRADLSHARVIREGRSYPVNLAGALAGGSAGSIVLNSNDVLVVPKRTGFTREDASFALGVVGALVGVLNLVATLTR